MSLLLTLNRFHTLFWCFHCWLSKRKCRLGSSFASSFHKFKFLCFVKRVTFIKQIQKLVKTVIKLLVFVVTLLRGFMTQHSLNWIAFLLWGAKNIKQRVRNTWVWNHEILSNFGPERKKSVVYKKKAFIPFWFKPCCNTYCTRRLSISRTSTLFLE